MLSPSRTTNAPSAPRRDDAQAIRSNLSARTRAIREKDATALLASYAHEVVTFDLVEPLKHRGLPSLRDRVEDWFDSFASDIDYSMTDIVIEVSGDLAIDHHLTHVRGRNVTGRPIDMWYRETETFRRIDGVWKVTHQHSSVPFDMKTMNARLDLSPDD